MIIQAQSQGGEVVKSGEAGVFFAATVPFIAILIVGLVGISRINEGIAKIPVRSHAQTPPFFFALFVGMNALPNDANSDDGATDRRVPIVRHRFV